MENQYPKPLTLNQKHELREFRKDLNEYIIHSKKLSDIIVHCQKLFNGER